MLEATSPWPSPPAEREDEESGSRQDPGPAGTRSPEAQAARASWANSLNRVSSPSWADQMARSWPSAMRPCAVSQRSLDEGSSVGEASFFAKASSFAKASEDGSEHGDGSSWEGRPRILSTMRTRERFSFSVSLRLGSRRGWSAARALAQASRYF